MSLSKNSVTILLSILGIVGGWGTAYLSNYDKLKRGSNLAEQAKIWARLREGHYQWQWGKGGWLGDLSIKKDYSGQMCATVDISKYCGHSGVSIGKVLTSQRCGVLEETADGQPKLTIPVRHVTYNDRCEKTGEGDQTLVIVLNPREAYTGSIDYIDGNGQTSTGSIGVINWAYQPLTGTDKSGTEHK
jgi:hypothetical protein